MAKKKVTARSLPKKYIQIAGSVLIVALIAIYGVYQIQPSHAATAGATFTASPSSGTYAVGSTISVSVNEDSGTDGVTTVQADLTFPADILAYTSVDATASQFTDVAPPPTLTAGMISISRGSTVLRTGSQNVVTVNFTVLKSGTATVAFASSSQIYRDSDLTNIYVGGTGGIYTIPGGHKGGGGTSSGGGHQPGK